ncbi:hypothetical protein AWB71_06202 [Caballeronia peredens]|nr:hypothetical protein AWB71_06202 [Caballeronia peredens]
MSTIGAKDNKWARRMRKASAYGPLDRALRQWRSLGSVRTGTGVKPNGDAMVYRMNDTTLEIGQGVNTFKGMVGLAGLFGLAVSMFGIKMAVILLTDFGTPGVLGITAEIVVSLLFILGGLWFSAIFVTDFFGYTDALVRFDRTRRKLWMFVGTREPIEMDWDSLTPVSQGITPANSNINAFRAVLLVDLDAQGDVKFEGRWPRIVSIGQTSLNEQQAISQYEYVRAFMENGPRGLPACETYLEHRNNLRSLVGFYGTLDQISGYRSTVDEQRITKIVLATLFWTVMSCVFLPFTLATWIAYRFNRVPKWPARIEAYAEEGGKMHPPDDACSQNRSIVWKEIPFIALWLGSALCVYVWLARFLSQ